jgi:arylsulfatase A-like enzyme
MNPTRKSLRRTALRLLLLIALGASIAHAAPPAAKPPNLLIVLPDQMRGQALGFLGEDPVLTPRLDTFAEQGLVLTEAISNYPVCSPYRAMLMTGKYPHANGVLSNCNSRSAPFGCELREEDRCWMDVLDDAGFSLGYIGKWHLDAPYRPFVESYNNRENFAWNEWCPPHRRHGFDFWYAYGTFDRHDAPEYWTTDAPRDRRVVVQQWGPVHEADMALRYLRNEEGRYRDPDAPFALVVAMNPPHMPYHLVPDEYVERYGEKTWRELINRDNVDLEGDTSGAKLAKKQIRNYLAMVTGVDEQFGRILDGLDEFDLAEDTIVLFTSDHGNCLGSHDEVSKNNHFEESMRVPFLIRWPGRIPARHDDLLLSTPDIYPTLLDLMGLADEIPEEVQGTSHATLFRTGEGDRPTSALYIKVSMGEPSHGRRGVRTHRYTLMIERSEGAPDRTLLHDNLLDPFQLRNVAGDHPEVVEKLIAEELLPWLRRTGDPWIDS